MILGWRDLWLCHLCGKGQLLLRRTGPRAEEMFVALGVLNNSVLVAWPVEGASEFAGLYQLTPKANADEHLFLVIDNLENWEVAPLRWYSPITSVINALPPAGILVYAAAWTSLLKASASLAFCSMSYPQLSLLALV